MKRSTLFLCLGVLLSFAALSSCKSEYDRMLEKKGEYIGIREMRKHIAWYTEGIKNSSKVRNQVCSAETREEVVDIISQML